jgi:hypothetical protein
VLVWKSHNPSVNGALYCMKAMGKRGLWLRSRSRVRGVWQHVLWLGGTKRFPPDGPGYATADEAIAVANAEDAQ